MRPGEEYQCNGCHVANSGLSHGRMEAFDSAYAGAQSGWLEFPNTDPQWFVGAPGETMAEIRARVSCANSGGISSIGSGTIRRCRRQLHCRGR